MWNNDEPTIVRWLTLCLIVCIAHMSSSHRSISATQRCENTCWSPTVELLEVQFSVGDQRVFGCYARVLRSDHGACSHEIRAWCSLDGTPNQRPTNVAWLVGWHLTAVTQPQTRAQPPGSEHPQLCPRSTVPPFLSGEIVSQFREPSNRANLGDQCSEVGLISNHHNVWFTNLLWSYWIHSQHRLRLVARLIQSPYTSYK